MYQKIVSQDQLDKLKVGDVVIKHPANGSKAENFYLAEISNGTFFTISDKNDDVIELLTSSVQSDRKSTGEILIAPFTYESY